MDDYRIDARDIAIEHAGQRPADGTRSRRTVERTVDVIDRCIVDSNRNSNRQWRLSLDVGINGDLSVRAPISHRVAEIYARVILGGEFDPEYGMADLPCGRRRDERDRAAARQQIPCKHRVVP